MKRTLTSIAVLLLLAIALGGCSTDPEPVDAHFTLDLAFTLTHPEE